MKRMSELAKRYSLPEEAVAKLTQLLELLARNKWAATAVSSPGEAADSHIADSLVALEAVAINDGARVVDIGSGAGFPGLPLAVARPHVHFDLLESAARKLHFTRSACLNLSLENVGFVPQRAEQWASGEGNSAYDFALCRAVAPLVVLVEYAAPLLKFGGTFIAWKGKRDEGEESAGQAAAATLGLKPLDAVYVEPYPGSSNRNLHIYEKIEQTPAGFPRRPGIALKRPLC